MHETVQDWILDHNADYARVRDRLEAVRNVVLRGRLDAAASVLKRSYVFAVLSIKTERDRHERAFTAHYAGALDIEEAALETVYGGNKKWWLTDTFETVDWEALALALRTHVREGRRATLLEAIVGACKGVSYRKGAFMLAMAGLYEYSCVDSNVARHAGLEESTGDALEFDDAQDYLETADAIMENSLGLPPFLAQWAIYDFERGEHARHMAYFREAIGW